MLLPRLFLVLPALLLFSFLTGCVGLGTSFNSEAKPAARAARGAPFWRDKNVSGPRKIVINLTAQRAYFLKGETLLGESNISSGRKGFETPPGRYRVIQKDKDHVSNLYGDYIDEDGDIVQRNVDVTKDPRPDETEFAGAKMPYFLRFTRGYGMHAGNVPRYRASHGCIRLPSKMAQHFFEAAEIGTAVVVEQ